MSKLFLILLLILGLVAEARVLIATVAQVKSHVITSRELGIHQELDRVLGKKLEHFSVNEIHEQVIREWLLFYEASTFYNSQIENAQVSEVFKVAIGRLTKSKKWKELDVSQKEMRQKLVRRLEASRLYQFKKKASVLPVGLAEIETEYTQNRVFYGNQSFAEVKDKIRKNKIEANLTKRMEQWFQVLEQKYKVQRFSKFKPK